MQELFEDSPVDDWLEIENNDLRQQVEEVDLQNEWLQEAADKAIEAKKKMTDTLSRERATFRDESTEKNHQITNKCVALSNLCDEYQLVLDKYVEHTGMKLTTTKLNQLKEKGGYL